MFNISFSELTASSFPHTPTPIRPCEYLRGGSSFSSFFLFFPFLSPASFSPQRHTLA
jgi:hypothetical protein